MVVGVDEFGEDGDPGVGLEDFFPEVAGGEFAVDDWVACAAVGSAVEGEEAGCFSCQFGGHGGFVLGECEVDEGAAVFLEQGRGSGVTVGAVLVDGVLEGLGVFAFEFDGGYG